MGPDGRDGGRGGIRAAASKMGETGKAVRKCIELSVIDERVEPQTEKASRGRNRGPFFNSTFNFFPRVRH